MTRPRIQYICARCGSSDVTRDAISRWSEIDQCWEVSDTLDHADCNEFCGETTLRAVELVS